ncbi:MAG: exodeoxyribonuclease VII large subunit [Chitinispirillaceae bacterium]|nr:exodeoxyribonuclease VII large subunit [Chitinispirillaceae bacterium]
MTGTRFAFLPPQQAPRPYTVSEINEGVSLILESSNTLVWVEGELSNWKIASSGHCYFRLKDAECHVPAVMWRQSMLKLDYEPEDGLKVLVIASIKVYRKAGYYQLDCHRMEPIGKGALALAFEKLKQRLEKEGLFDFAHKVPIPSDIRRLGVVTSRQGAVIHDIARVIASRSPSIDIVLVDVPVQGAAAALRIVQAIHDLNTRNDIDCMIVGRGGGSIEDLRAWNEEAVARAIYESVIPVVSAVGHEIDVTITDFVADLRAPTPSAAAEMIAPDREERSRYLTACSQRFSAAFSRFLTGAADRYDACRSVRSFLIPFRKLLEYRQVCDDHAERCSRSLRAHLQTVTRRFSSDSSRLNALSPLTVLSRGYCVVTAPDGQAVRDAGQLVAGLTVAMRFHKGSASARILTSSSPHS